MEDKSRGKRIVLDVDRGENSCFSGRSPVVDVQLELSTMVSPSRPQDPG